MADMRYRRLGNSGLVVSVVGLGCNNFGGRVDAAGTQAVVDAAIDAGITLLDTADSYGRPAGQSEELLGAALKGKRDDVILATKFSSDLQGINGADWGARGGRRYIIRAVESSLRRLQTDYIDLYQYHWPDTATPLEETLAALDDVVRAGKVRYLGSSNFAGWQVAHSAWLARTNNLTPFISAQNEYSLLTTGVEADLVPALQHFGVGLLPYFPLASGLLTGKYQRGAAAPGGTRLTDTDPRLAGADWDRIEAIAAFAAQRSLSLLDVAIGGLAAKPTVSSVIAGATKPEQVLANAAAGSWVPTDEDLAALNRL